MTSIQYNSVPKKNKNKTVGIPTLTTQKSVASIQTPATFDFSKLSTDEFDTETYIRTLLQKLPNESGVQQLHVSLTTAKEQTSMELQKNVYKNYNEFVIISKEITKLEKDMLSCKKVLQDLRFVKTIFEECLPREVEIHASKVAKIEIVDREAETGRELLRVMYKEIEGLQVLCC
jgi:hypothetical protein